tara:strand:- start:305 stop:754 length:450 start_codon:yes stop_codon:yes gene_type:complete
MSKKKTTPAPAPATPATQRGCAAAWLQAKTAAGRGKHLADAKSRTKLGFKRLAAAMEAGDRELVQAWAVDAFTRNSLKAARRDADAPVKAPAKAPTKGKAKSRKAAKAPAKAPAYADAETAALAYAALVKAGAGETAAAVDALAFLTRR